MLNLDEDKLRDAIVERAADEIIGRDEYLDQMVAKEVKSRIDAIFKNRAEAAISAAIDEAVKDSFDREYQKAKGFGEAGEATTIRKELLRIVDAFWSEKVDPKSGRPSTNYASVSRAEYLMTTICADDFSAKLKQDAIQITGALKDGLRNKMGERMDAMLNDLFRVKSLQDQGKVKKPY